MMSKSQPKAKAQIPRTSAQTVELVTFYVGDVLFGMNILKVQEINKQIEMTSVPHAPDYVLGILNLRGRIVTIVDLAKKFSLSHAEISDKTRVIIVNSQDEHIGLLVDRIGDVVLADMNLTEQAPSNIGGVMGVFFEGVYKTEDGLIGIVDVEEVLKE